MSSNNFVFKSKWFNARHTLIIGLILQIRVAAAQNLVANPGFETGDTSGWFGFGSPTLMAETSQVHSGTYSCLVTNRAATWNGIAQSFVGVLQPGETYDVSAWVRLVNGGNQTLQLTLQKIDGSGTSYAVIASGSVSSSGWAQLSGQYTYNPSGAVSALNFYAEMPGSSNASYYIDDVNLSAQTVVTNSPISGLSTVNWNSIHQRIDGFGASSAYDGSWKTNQADILFSTNLNVVFSDSSNNKYTNNGIALSLLRNHIVPANDTSVSSTPTTVETSIMKWAQDRGARVWSTPWTPAVGFKQTNDIYDSLPITNAVNGGSFRGGVATNQAYASQLANYVASMKSTYGINLYAISIQNEPDASVNTYDACQWTNTFTHDFVTNLYNALAAKGVGSTKIILPESQNWQDYHNLAGPAMADANVAADVSIIADHNYDGASGPGNLTKNSYGKALWETEVSQLNGEHNDISNGVYYALRIYQFITLAQANAWHYWWIIPFGSETGLMSQNAGPTKRMFAIGNYSRFVRPNYYRMDATSSQPSMLITAYKATNSTDFAIVAVNTNAATDVIQTFSLTNFTAAIVTPWITSASLSLAPQTPVNVTNFSFTYAVPALSVVTFAGQGNTPPQNGLVSDQAVNPGMTLLVTNITSDSDLPPQVLTFSAANTFPSNATINSSSGVFSWRPLVRQANTTNLIQIKVTDSGQPNLSATNSFKVIVNPISQPVLSSIMVSNGQVDLLVNGPSGPDYTLLTSTNLPFWQSILTIVSPLPPVGLIDTNFPNGPLRFYRIQLGP